MGTNFYWVGTTPDGEDVTGDLIGDDDPTVHIGKRSAAGLYCWRCRVTLCADGEARIHAGGAWFLKACPRCHAEPTPVRPLDEGPAAVELGFAKPAVTPPSDVRGAASFGWAQEPGTVRAFCEAHPDTIAVQDEYGRQFTCREFLRMLEANCPIEFTDSVGRAFS